MCTNNIADVIYACTLDVHCQHDKKVIPLHKVNKDAIDDITSFSRLCPSKLKGFNRIATANPPADLTLFRSSIAAI